MKKKVVVKSNPDNLMVSVLYQNGNYRILIKNVFIWQKYAYFFDFPAFFLKKYFIVAVFIC